MRNDRKQCEVEGCARPMAVGIELDRWICLLHFQEYLTGPELIVERLGYTTRRNPRLGGESR